MNNVKSLICKEIISEGAEGNIYKIVNILLENKSDNNNDILIDIYINHDQYNQKSIFDKFTQAVGEYFNNSFSKKQCIKYLLFLEIETILSKKISYYNGFKNIEKIIHFYNKYDNLSKEEAKKYTYGDVYGETISNTLSELLHAFDITDSTCFSEYNTKNMAIEEINILYENSTVDNLLKDLLVEFSV